VNKWENVDYWKFRLDKVREIVHEIDLLTWKKNTVKGYENHRYLVATSDFEGDPDMFATRLNNFLDEIHNQDPLPQKVRLAYIGVPPLFTDIYDVVETFGARVVFNEVQRQFSMPFKSKDVVDQYLRYTYPYPIFRRIADIKKEISRRNIHGIIHYAESFCYRQIEDVIFRREFGLPYIMVESGGNFFTDARTKMRLQAFVEMLKEKVEREEAKPPIEVAEDESSELEEMPTEILPEKKSPANDIGIEYEEL